MLLAFFECWFVRVAWRNGWKALALIPLGADVLLAMFLGMSGMKPDDFMPIAIAGDIATCIILGFMAAIVRAPAAAATR